MLTASTSFLIWFFCEGVNPVGFGVGVVVTGGVVVVAAGAGQDIPKARDRATAIAMKINVLLLFIAIIPPYTVAGSTRNTF